MKIKKMYIMILIILTLSVLFINNKSYAVLQSNSETPTTKNISNWMTQIRNMEAIGGSLGLEETIEENLLSNTSNNLDCHMEKNTEYAAMAILSASSYGNPEKIEDGGTTTGNESGVIININKEWVAAGTISSCSAYANASSRYKNLYTSIYSAKIGDAITETQGWHENTESTWIRRTLSGANYPIHYEVGVDNVTGLVRSYSGSVFSYYGYGYNYYRGKISETQAYHTYYDAYYGKEHASRAVIVIGEGF